MRTIVLMLGLVGVASAADDPPLRLTAEKMLPARHSDPAKRKAAWEELKKRFDGKSVQVDGHPSPHIGILLQADKKAKTLVMLEGTDRQKAEIKQAGLELAQDEKKDRRISVTGVCRFKKVDPKDLPNALIDKRDPYYVIVEIVTMK